MSANEFAPIHPSEISHFAEFGFCVVPGLFSLSECDRLVEISHDWQHFKTGKKTSVMNPHLSDKYFFEALSNRNLISVLIQLMNVPKISGIQSQFFYGPPGCSGYTNHQDNFFIQANPQYFISAWTALEDTFPENGGLIVFPKSHMDSILEVQEVEPSRRGVGQDPNSDKLEIKPSVIEKYEAVNLVVPKGSTVFIHANLIHASNSNSTADSFRHVLLSTYIKTGEYFRKGNYANRIETPL